MEAFPLSYCKINLLPPARNAARSPLAGPMRAHLGPDTRALAGVIAELVPSERRVTAYDYVLDVLRPPMWPPSQCGCEFASLAWRALPLVVR